MNRRFIKAQGMTEYILLIFLIAIAAWLSVSKFGHRINSQAISAGNKLRGATTVRR